MNEKNFDFLKDQIKFTGFGQDLEAALKENLAKAQTEFRLQHTTQYGKDQMSSSLHFKKASQSDLYFFNSYTATLNKENNSQPVKQTFYINKGAGNITQKEAFNLLDGRAVNKDMVNKEGNLYNAWVQINFKETAMNGNFKLKQFSQKYGFDLEKSLAKLPIQELADQTGKERLIESLQKGNRQAVTLSGAGNEQKVFVEANPQFKAIIVYDQSHRRLTLDRPKQTQNQSESNQQSVKNQNGEQKQKATSEHTQEPARKNKTGKRI
ncbi:hypothetical protein [Dyadobacter sp. CY356]|uniref:hypothetical protein n=1 Tax=Dyadobacter sp. CY356 TaxID=2906442 RepID=UPI001F27533B|nr:hypothetical protein [Dyadobacter sp. CY356]MCF0055186.1 hypothetical protein [Dyadobacter sp. CY356]